MSSVQVSGIESAIAGIKRRSFVTSIRVKAECAVTAAEIEQTAKLLVAVDTGKLKNSIRTEDKGGVEILFHVSANTDYAIHQEFGTSRMRGRAFLRPAVLASKIGHIERIKQALG